MSYTEKKIGGRLLAIPHNGNLNGGADVRFGSEVDDGHAGYLIRTHKSWAAHDCSLALHCAMHHMGGVIDAGSIVQEEGYD